MADPRIYPQRPFLAVSAAIVRDGKVLVVRRARRPALAVYTMPGGVVEAGETLTQAVMREVREETALDIEPVAFAGHREVIVRDAQGAEIYAWNTVLEQSVLKPGERAAFRSRLASPPAEGRSIDVRFFTRRDIAGGSV